MPTVAQLIVEGLERAGVSRLFGVPGGGSNLDLLDAAEQRGLPFVLCHHEWAAVIMAAVTGDLTGAPGAAFATLGPGVAASAVGLAHAFLDRSPMIFVSDRHPDAVLSFTTHQRVDHAAMLSPIVKGSVTVSTDSASHAVAHAVQLALKEPRGPVHLDLPADVSGRAAVPAASNVTQAPGRAPAQTTLDRAADMIAAASRPVVIAGLQCRTTDAKWLRAFCEALPAPCLTTYKAKGAIPDPHPLSLGVFTGGVLEEPVVRRADLIIWFGLDPVEIIPRRWPYTAPVLSFTRCSSSDADAEVHGGYVTPALEVVGDLGAILEDLAPRVVPRAKPDWDVVEVDRLRQERARALEVAVPGLAPHRVVQMAREFTPAGTIATVDAGAHIFPATAYWHAVEPGELLISNGLATMGFALPAAIAAQLVAPDRRVLCLIGDGGLLMAAAELETVARLRLPIVVVVFDDSAPSLIQVKREQKGHQGGSLSYGGTDLAALARSFGIEAFAAEDERGFQAALFSALAASRPALIDARIDASGYRRTLEIVRGAPPERR
jgi:acetolactate synthase-1/2/3 large subunit